jgi:uncharacterized damage-inducible protein DinB
MLIESIHHHFDELTDLLDQLSDQRYSEVCKPLSNSSIGEHIRHIIEMFQCLEKGYDSGIINYDKRERNLQIQTEIQCAVQAVLHVKSNLQKENKKLYIEQMVDDLTFRIQTNYYRELLYNIEHCIHHQALIKVAVMELGNVSLKDNFGVARSTIEFRNKCVQ